MKQIYVESYFKGYKKLTNYSLLKDHPQREVIERRLKIISFCEEFGQRATREAFGVARSTIFVWKKKLNEAKGRLTALAPLSKAPKTRGKRRVNQLIVKFIKDYRTNHPGVSKEAIKPHLDKYCLNRDLFTVSESTIGRIIRDLKAKNLIPDMNSSVSYWARSDSFRAKLVKRRQKKLRRGGYQPKEAGDLIQMDTVAIFHNGIKRYIFTAYDLKVGFAFAYAYKSATSQLAVDFFQNLRKVAPFAIKRIQTDNGSEFLGAFRDYIQKEKIIHYHNFPRRPQSNPFIERFNRTIQEQHVRWHKDELYDIDQFNKGLMKYLVWYNIEKPHKRLNKHPPLKYYIDNYIDKRQESNIMWTTSAS